MVAGVGAAMGVPVEPRVVRSNSAATPFVEGGGKGKGKGGGGGKAKGGGESGGRGDSGRQGRGSASGYM